MYGEGLCINCGKTTVFEKVQPTVYYPESLYCCGYCTECGEIGCNTVIVNLRLVKHRSDDINDYYLKLPWAVPYWKRGDKEWIAKQH